MSQPKEPPEAKLVMGLLYRDSEWRKRAIESLCKRFGPLDFLSQPEAFTYTTYYEEEMGKDILRQTASFLNLVSQENLSHVKLITNQIEEQVSIYDKRQVNIDPGLLSEERLVLATGKNYTHRIYVGKGIYADLTLIFQKGSYRALPWTYPDYRSPRLLHFLAVIRRKLQFQLNGRLPRKGLSGGAKIDS